MSASERLKALEERINQLRNVDSLGEVQAYRKIPLPELIAVVEAAAEHYDAMARYYKNDPDEWWPQLRTALAALDEVLTTKGEQ